MANNQYVNKVSYDGTTLIDLTIDTAVASDVAQGKYFHLATGERVQGTASGGGGGGGSVTQDQDGYIVLPSTGGGGGGSSFTLLATESYIVSTTSTSWIDVGTIELGAEAWTKDDIIYVHVRGQSGKRTGYHYGTDSILINYMAANNQTGTMGNSGYVSTRCDASGKYVTTGNQYGVFGYSINNSGDLLVRARYSSSSSLTIDDTFDVYVYKLSLPSGIALYE